MARGSRFSSTLQWFREGDIDEVRAILPLVQEAVAARSGQSEEADAGAANPKRSAAARRAWRTRRANAANAADAGVGEFSSATSFQNLE